MSVIDFFSYQWYSIKMLKIDTRIDALSSEALEATAQPQSYTEVFKGQSDQRDATRTQFLEGNVENPILNEKTGLDDAEQHRARRNSYAGLSALRNVLEDQITEGDTGPATEATLGFVKKRQAELAFLQGAEAYTKPGLGHASFLGDERLSQFMGDWAKEFWKSADQETAQSLIKTAFDPERRPEVKNPEDQMALRLYYAVAMELPDNLPEPYKPSAEALAHYHDLLMDRFGNTFAYQFEDVDAETFTEEEAVPIFGRALEHLGLAAKGWRVVLDLNRKNMSTSTKDKIVYVGQKASPFTRDDICRLTIHEIGIHAARSQNAIDAGLNPLATRGLPGFLDFEEAFANAMEHAYLGRVQNKLARLRYAAGSFAQGVIDGQEHDFRETFGFTWGYLLSDLASQDVKLDDERLAKEKLVIYNQVARLFRGMPGRAGLNDLQALSYYGGYKKVWSVLDRRGTYLNDAEFNDLFAAKYDPTDQLHNQVIFGVQ